MNKSRYNIPQPNNEEIPARETARKAKVNDKNGLFVCSQISTKRRALCFHLPYRMRSNNNYNPLNDKFIHFNKNLKRHKLYSLLIIKKSQ